MTVTFKIPGYLREFTGGRSEVSIDSCPNTIGGGLAALWAAHPGLRDRIVNEQGEVRQHVNIFVGAEAIRFTGGLTTPVPDGSEIFIVPSISGGLDGWSAP